MSKTATDTVLWVAQDRHGSGRVIHRGVLHGVSSVRLACGKLMLRIDAAGLYDKPVLMTRGVRPCPKCEKASA